MSFDVFLQRFADGDAAPADADALLAVLEPLIAVPFHGGAQIATVDGGADVYMSDPGSSLMFSRPAGQQVWDLMYDLALVGGLAVMPVGCGTGVVDEATLAELPESIPQPVRVVRSGADLIDLVRSA